MLTTNQYKTLNGIRERTDAIIDGKEKFEVRLWHLSALSDWNFLRKNKLIHGKISDLSTITFPGRVALAAYEGQHV